MLKNKEIITHICHFAKKTTTIQSDGRERDFRIGRSCTKNFKFVQSRHVN